jgi:hypothetical protein
VIRSIARILAPFASLILGIALAITLVGCAASALIGMAPQAIEMAGMAAGSGVQSLQGKNEDVAGIDPAEMQERCEQLTRVTPGVEEVREAKDGVVESRRWRIVGNADQPAWMISPSKSAPVDGWESKPAISKLEFEPPLTESLKAGGDSQFLAYTPSDIKTPADSELFDSLTSVFGPAQGSFKWRERTYDYVMVPKLPCFKPRK